MKKFELSVILLPHSDPDHHLMGPLQQIPHNHTPPIVLVFPTHCQTVEKYRSLSQTELGLKMI